MEVGFECIRWSLVVVVVVVVVHLLVVPQPICPNQSLLPPAKSAVLIVVAQELLEQQEPQDPLASQVLQLLLESVSQVLLQPICPSFVPGVVDVPPNDPGQVRR
jgi:hypothetical protein